MQCAVIIYMLLFLDNIWLSDVTRAFRPNRPSYYQKIDEQLLSHDDMQKARARWNADVLSRATDDEDMLIDPETGSGAEIQNDAGTRTHHVMSQNNLGSEHCCKLGKIAGGRERSCHSSYYVKRLKAIKIRQRLHRKNSRHRSQSSNNSQWRPEDRLLRLFKKCALQKNSHFQKCCTAASSSYRRNKVQRSRYSSARRWRQRGRRRY